MCRIHPRERRGGRKLLVVGSVQLQHDTTDRGRFFTIFFFTLTYRIFVIFFSSPKMRSLWKFVGTSAVQSKTEEEEEEEGEEEKDKQFIYCPIRLIAKEQDDLEATIG